MFSGKFFFTFSLTKLYTVSAWAEDTATLGSECAGINRHVVGDERALQERSSDSILTSSLARYAVRRAVEA